MNSLTTADETNPNIFTYTWIVIEILVFAGVVHITLLVMCEYLCLFCVRKSTVADTSRFGYSADKESTRADMALGTQPHSLMKSTRRQTENN